MAFDKDGDVVMTPGDGMDADVNPGNSKDLDESQGSATASVDGDDGTEGSAKDKNETETPADVGPPPAERVSSAETAKEEGNAFLKAGDFQSASGKYGEGIGLVEPLMEKDPGELGEELQKRGALVYQALCLNRAQAGLKLSDWILAIEHAEKVLTLDKDNTKALYRRGCASLMLDTEGRLEQAKADFTRVATLDPSNKEVRGQLEKAKNRLRDVRQAEKQRIAEVMAGGLYKDEHAKLGKQQALYQKEVDRRKEAGEDEISFTDWCEKEKEKVEKAKNKQKEKLEQERAAEQERLLLEAHEKENARRQEAGEDEISYDDWKEAEIKKVEEIRKARVGGVVEVDDADLDADEKKLLEETKSKGYYHGRLGTVLSDAAPKPIQVEASSVDQLNGNQVGSEWNQAGTWEEKGQTVWVKEQLNNLFPGVVASSSKVKLPSGRQLAVKAKVYKVKSLTGDAQLVWVRKQPKHGYNFEIEVTFKVTMSIKQDPSENGEAVADKVEQIKGSFGMPEFVDTVQPADLRIDTRYDAAVPSEFGPVVTEWLDKLKDNIRAVVANFRQEYQKRR